MTKGDNLFGIKTTYKGIEMRSKLESRIALFLDALNIKWEYEPKTFLLSNGHPYKPDFYLPELKQWIEVKGDIKDHNKEFSMRFVEENKTELILISNEKAFFFYNWFIPIQDAGYYHGDSFKYTGEGEEDAVCCDDNLFVGLCSNCGKYFYCGNLGSYHCRACGTHNGDHDLKYNLQGDFYWNGQGKIDFYNLDSIKEGLKNYGASI